MKCRLLSVALAITLSTQLKADDAGYLIQPITGKVAVVVNRQKLLPADSVKAATEGLRAMLSLPIEVMDADTASSQANRIAVRMNLVEDTAAPMVRVVPDEASGSINISAIASDAPAPSLLEKRLEKQFWRAFALALGVGYSPLQPDLLARVRTLAELDALSDKPCPQSFNQMMSEAESVGVQLLRYATYRRACEEGWAPAPTNDAQRVVWEKVKAEQRTRPVKGLKIKYDPKKGK